MREDTGQQHRLIAHDIFSGCDCAEFSCSCGQLWWLLATWR